MPHTDDNLQLSYVERLDILNNDILLKAPKFTSACTGDFFMAATIFLQRICCIFLVFVLLYR